MIIYAIAAEIHKWIDEHGGKSPNRLRISQRTMDAIEDDLRQMQLYPDPESMARGETRIAGILLVVDPTITIGHFE